MTKEDVRLDPSENDLNSVSGLMISKRVFAGHKVIKVYDTYGRTILELGAESAHLFSVALFGACEDRNDPIPEPDLTDTTKFRPGDLVLVNGATGTYGDDRGWLVWTNEERGHKGKIGVVRSAGMGMIWVDTSELTMVQKQYRPSHWF